MAGAGSSVRIRKELSLAPPSSEMSTNLSKFLRRVVLSRIGLNLWALLAWRRQDF